MTPTVHTGQSGFRVACSIAFLAGIWFFVSPWVYGSYGLSNAWNNWIVGAAIAILAAFRLGYPPETMWISWINCLLGIWTFTSPWVYGYNTDHDRLVNSLCVGVVLFVVGLWNGMSAPQTSHRNQQISTHS